jgi:hypothetical protein
MGEKTHCSAPLMINRGSWMTFQLYLRSNPCRVRTWSRANRRRMGDRPRFYGALYAPGGPLTHANVRMRARPAG